MSKLNEDSRILILCTGNSCRSQMAEGWFRHYLTEAGLAKAAAAVKSAGVETHGVNPTAVKVMGEMDVDISGHTSNNVSEYRDHTFDYVITVCDSAAERCPVFPAETQRLHWPFDDPAKASGNADEILAKFRLVRDQIGARIKEWVGEQT